MPQLVKMNASAIGGTIQTNNSGVITVPADGIVTVNSLDAAQLLAAGATYIHATNRYQQLNAAPVVATAGRIVASTSLANGTLSIANQPDVPRQCGIYVDPGTTAITAGAVTATYIANDGSTTIDVVSAVTAASTPFTTNTSKGVVVMNSVVVTGVVGGTTPHTQVNDTNSFGLSVDPGFVDFKALRENTDGANGTIGTVASTAASITPNTTPNGTHTYSWNYSYNTADT